VIGGYFLKKVLDLIILLLIHSTNTKNRKQTEKVLRSKIRLGCLPEKLMQNAFQNHSMVSADSALGLPLLFRLSEILSDDGLTLCCIIYTIPMMYIYFCFLIFGPRSVSQSTSSVVTVMCFFFFRDELSSELDRLFILVQNLSAQEMWSSLRSLLCVPDTLLSPTVFLEVHMFTCTVFQV